MGENEVETKTLDKIYEKFESISIALSEIDKNAFTQKMLRLYLKEETKLPYRDIDAVLDAVRKFMKEAQE